MSRFWSPIVSHLTPYVPGEQPKLSNFVKLNTNENPYPPSPKVLMAMRTALDDSLRLYPDPNADILKKAIAERFDLGTEQIFVGNGSDEVLGFAFLALLKHDKPLLFPDITYSFYPVYCGLYQVAFETVPLSKDFTINIDDYLKQDAGAVIFPNPNAPTGSLLSLIHIERLLVHKPDAVVVIDEAYIDFGGESAASLVSRYPNLLVVQTLSKSYSLAGLRVGFALGDASLIEALERVKNSFNSYPLDRLAIAGATAAIEDQAYFNHTRHAVIASRELLCTELKTLGFDVLPSAANFIFAQHPTYDAVHITARLRERGIIVRHFNQARIDQFCALRWVQTSNVRFW